MFLVLHICLLCMLLQLVIVAKAYRYDNYKGNQHVAFNALFIDCASLILQYFTCN